MHGYTNIKFEIEVLNYTKIASQLRVVPSFRMPNASLCSVRTASLLQQHRKGIALFRLLKVMMFRNLVHNSNNPNTGVKCKDLTNRYYAV